MQVLGLRRREFSQTQAQPLLNGAPSASRHRIACKENRMPELLHIDPRSAALLVMDYKVDTLIRYLTAARSADAIASVPDLIALARDARA